MSIKNFMKQNFKHFNSVLLVEAAEAYSLHLKKGGKMFMTLGGAMSTAELGISLAEMIRQNKVNAICSTGANLEEDIFNLVAHDFYKRISNWRELSPRDEVNLRDSGLNRVTDTCIPEEEAFRRLERTLLKFWKKAEQKRKRYFPYEFMYQIIKSGDLKKYYQIDPKNSWVIAACEKNIPIFTPGSEDSTLGNIFVSNVIKKNLKRIDTVKSGYEQMAFLIDWYRKESRRSSIGFFQIAGGIAGDFPICVVPLIHQDMGENCPYWGYFCQISDSTTSYGSYSGAVPNEKITWGKLDVNPPRFIIESDATIVAPLIFAYVLGK